MQECFSSTTMIIHHNLKPGRTLVRLYLDYVPPLASSCGYATYSKCITFPGTCKLQLTAGTASRFITVLDNSFQASVTNEIQCGLGFMPHSLKKGSLNQVVQEQIWYKPHRALRWGWACSHSTIWQMSLFLLSSSSWRYSAACCLAAAGSEHLYTSMLEDILQKYQTALRHKCQIHKYIMVRTSAFHARYLSNDTYVFC